MAGRAVIDLDPSDDEGSSVLTADASGLILPPGTALADIPAQAAAGLQAACQQPCEELHGCQPGAAEIATGA